MGATSNAVRRVLASIPPAQRALLHKRHKYPVLTFTQDAETLAPYFRAADLANKTLVDINCGFGYMTAALFAHPPGGVPPAHAVLVEQERGLAEYVRTNPPVPNATVLEMDQMATAFHHHWMASEDAPAKVDWSRPPEETNVTAVATIGTKLGDLNWTHFLRWMADRGGLHALGRVPMYLFLTRTYSQRMFAMPGSTNRGRLSVLTDAMVHAELLLERPEKELAFYPYLQTIDLVRIEPRETPLFKDCTLEELEFVARSLFVKKLLTSSALKTLDPTGKYLIKEIPGDVLAKRTLDLTTEELVTIAEVFAKWPLKHEFHGTNLFTGAMNIG
ncbi:hypothetical protein GGF32_009415 [Allomyces javanicus]|nr:hypothetical protein GGF32_009415 [Allomyces javanicus]